MQTHTYTHTQPLWRHVFVVCFACGGAEAFEVLVIPSVSICVVSKILEQKFWPFKGDMSDASWSTRGQMIFPNLGSWQWTTIANLLARILCQCQSSFHRVQNVLLPGTCFVRPRDFLAVKFAPASCKAAGVWGFPNWLAAKFDTAISVTCERCGLRKVPSLFSAMYASTKNKIWNPQQGSRVPAARRVPFFRSFFSKESRPRKRRTANRIPKSHWYHKIKR